MWNTSEKLITWRDHFTHLKCVRHGHALVDVLFKNRYDTLTEVSTIVTVRLNLNPEVVKSL